METNETIAERWAAAFRMTLQGEIVGSSVRRSRRWGMELLTVTVEVRFNYSGETGGFDMHSPDATCRRPYFTYRVRRNGMSRNILEEPIPENVKAELHRIYDENIGGEHA